MAASVWVAHFLASVRRENVAALLRITLRSDLDLVMDGPSVVGALGYGCHGSPPGCAAVGMGPVTGFIRRRQEIACAASVARWATSGSVRGDHGEPGPGEGRIGNSDCRTSLVGRAVVRAPAVLAHRRGPFVLGRGRVNHSIRWHANVP